MGRVSMTVPQFRRHECTVDGQRMHLSPFEAELVAALLVSPPWKFVHQDTLTDVLWPDPDQQALTARNVISVLVARLRGLGLTIDNEFGRGFSIPLHARDGNDASPPKRCPTCNRRIAA